MRLTITGPLVGVPASAAPGRPVLPGPWTPTTGSNPALAPHDGKDRPGSVVDSDPDRYELFGNAALAEIAREMGVGPAGEVSNYASPETMRLRWRRMRRKGKWLTLVRLAKATTTYAGGVDYLAWKINRHAGTKIEVKPWQRRWPILGALTLLPRLLWRGAIR